jgi:hypothetical protein
MGYANRLVHVDFTEELAEPGDSIWVTIRNPKHLTAAELRPREVALMPDGVTPVNMDDATNAMYETLSKLIVGWRVYDASDLTLDANGQPMPQPLLPTPATPEMVAKLPVSIVKRLSEEVTNAVNPQ